MWSHHLLQTPDKVFVNHKITSFVTRSHVTSRSSHKLFWFYDRREVNQNTRFRQDCLYWRSCKSSRNVGLRSTVQLQTCWWNWLSNSKKLKPKQFHHRFSSVLERWAKIIFGFKIGSLASPVLLLIIICLGNPRLSFEIVSVIGTSFLTICLLQKFLNCFLPKSEIFLTDLTISSLKTTVLLLEVVKLSVSKGLITKFSKSLSHHLRAFFKRPRCLGDAFYT